MYLHLYSPKWIRPPITHNTLDRLHSHTLTLPFPMSHSANYLAGSVFPHYICNTIMFFSLHEVCLFLSPKISFLPCSQSLYLSSSLYTLLCISPDSLVLLHLTFSVPLEPQILLLSVCLSVPLGVIWDQFGIGSLYGFPGQHWRTFSFFFFKPKQKPLTS